MEEQVSQTVGLTGYAGSGKDTAAQALLDIGWERRAFADNLRGKVADDSGPATGLLGIDPIVGSFEDGEWPFFNDDQIDVRLSAIIAEHSWDVAKRECPEVRRLQQTYGTEGGRNVHGQDCWIKAARATLVPGVDYVFTDVRFPNELEMIHQCGGVVIRIDRPGVGPVNAHSSDDIGGLNVDYEIQNDGTIYSLHYWITQLVGA